MLVKDTPGVDGFKAEPKILKSNEGADQLFKGPGPDLRVV